MDRRSFLHAIGALPVGTAYGAAGSRLATEPEAPRDRAPDSLGRGIPELDALAAPLRPGELLFVASPPCSGKTTLALTVAKHACEQHGRHVLYWGPHIDADRRLATAYRTLSAVERGAFEIRCMNAPLPLRAGAVAPGLLIIDAIPDHPAWVDIAANGEGADGARRFCRALSELSLRARCPILIATELAGLCDEPRSLPPALNDLGVLRKPAQRYGRVVLMHRPALYEPELAGLSRRVAELHSPRQCSDPAGPTHVALVHDADSGLYRGITEEECPAVWEQPGLGI